MYHKKLCLLQNTCYLQIKNPTRVGKDFLWSSAEEETFIPVMPSLSGGITGITVDIIIPAEGRNLLFRMIYHLTHQLYSKLEAEGEGGLFGESVELSAGVVEFGKLFLFALQPVMLRVRRGALPSEKEVYDIRYCRREIVRAG